MFISAYIKNQYGSRRGLLNAMLYSIKTGLGFYRQYQSVSPSRSTRFVFICSGNICRSPLAEYVAKQQGAHAISFGLHTRGGDKADERAIAFAKKVGIDLTPHATQNIKNYIPQEGDLLVGMEPAHGQELEVLFGSKVPITLVGLWLPNRQVYIHDPYGANPHFFSVCEQQVLDAVKQLVNNI